MSFRCWSRGLLPARATSERIAATFVVPFCRITRLRSVLTWERSRNYSIVITAIYVAAMVWFLAGGTSRVGRNGAPIGGDYIAFRTAGLQILGGEGRLLYDRARVVQLQTPYRADATRELYDPFRNPPFFALPFAALSPLGHVPSFLGWTFVSIACLITAVWKALQTTPTLRRRWRTIACLIAGYCPIYLNLTGGQNSSVSLLLYVLIYRALLRGREREAGLWAALGLLKPQLFLVFPLVFLASRRWRALGTYCWTTAGLAVVSTALVGVEGMMSWVRIISSSDLEGGITTHLGHRMHSLKAFFDLLLPDRPLLAVGLAAAASLVLVAAIVWIWAPADSWSREVPWRWVLTSVIAVLIDPHIFDYDLSVLVLTGLVAGAATPAARWWIALFYLLLLLRVTVPIGSVYLQPTVPLLLAFGCWLWIRRPESSMDAAPSQRRLPGFLRATPPAMARPAC